ARDEFLEGAALRVERRPLMVEGGRDPLHDGLGLVHALLRRGVRCLLRRLLRRRGVLALRGGRRAALEDAEPERRPPRDADTLVLRERPGERDEEAGGTRDGAVPPVLLQPLRLVV